MTVNGEPGQREWVTCPRPDDAVPAENTFKERLRRASRNRTDAAAPRTTVELLRLLAHPDAAERVAAQRELENHPVSLTWRGDEEARTGPWFSGVLHLSCGRIWRGNAHGDLHDVDELVNEVYDLHMTVIKNPAKRGYEGLATANEPWNVLCALFCTIARRRLFNGRSDTVPYVAKQTIDHLQRTSEHVTDAWRELAAGHPGPQWLADMVGDTLERNEVIHLLLALLGRDEHGPQLMLSPSQEAVARRIIRRRPPPRDAADAAADEIEDDKEDDDGELSRGLGG